ncbi:MAG: TerB family tellurite resistance protein [Bacteroides sp.]|nr:TerB family tellurite resistance protein [Bacteroides sp.]MCM1094913.1 TerB family tellurite resistance protein [Terasakiella sp.]
MITAPNTIASLLAACIWADGDYSEVERITAEEIAEAFDIPAKDFHKYMTAAMVEVQNLSPEAATTYAQKHAAKVDADETGQVFQALMQMMLCDGVLTAGEVYNLIALAETLDIDRETAVLLLCDLVKNEPELEVSFESDDE